MGVISGRVRALNLTVPLGLGRVGSDDLGYGPGSGFSFEPVQTSSSVHSKMAWRTHFFLFGVYRVSEKSSSYIDTHTYSNYFENIYIYILFYFILGYI